MLVGNGTNVPSGRSAGFLSWAVMVTMPTHARSGDDEADPAAVVDLAAVAGSGGVVWSVSPQGFHANLVVLGPHEAILSHRNDSVDVLIVVVAGDGSAFVDGRSVALVPSSALLVRRGAERSIRAGVAGLRYLTIHEQRGPLTIRSERVR